MKAICWQENPRLPRAVARLLGAMQMSAGDPGAWDFSDTEWRQALYFADRNQLSLIFRGLCGTRLPEVVRKRLDRDYAVNRDRVERIRERYTGMSREFTSRGIECVVLKGFAGAEEYFIDPTARVQYDLDLYCPESPDATRDALLAMGYRARARSEPATDHLPPMTRETGWQWRGDFFDPEMPITVEVHFRLWDEAVEQFEAPGWERFWQRRCGDILAPADALGYKALHALRHLLRGDFRAAQLYELACFLHRHAGDAGLWRIWRNTHGPELRRLEAISLALAQRWFDSRVPAIVQQELESLPVPVSSWLEAFASSPAEAFFRPSKQELWLHLRLLRSSSAKLRVLRRRLFPLRQPGMPPSSKRQTVGHWISRARFHLRSLAAAFSMMASRSRR